MTVQDDRRENELITLFQLQKPAKATRSGTDAVLYFNWREGTGNLTPFFPDETPQKIHAFSFEEFQRMALRG